MRGQKKGFKHTEKAKKAIGLGARGKGRGGFNVRTTCPVCRQGMSPANLSKHLPVCKMTRGNYLGDQELTVRELKVLRRRLKPLGWTTVQYVEQWNKQKGLCAICGNLPFRGRLAADHSHKSGKARGLLCENCNRGIGIFQDDPELLRAAANYLDPFKD